MVPRLPSESGLVLFAPFLPGLPSGPLELRSHPVGGSVGWMLGAEHPWGVVWMQSVGGPRPDLAPRR